MENNDAALPLSLTPSFPVLSWNTSDNILAQQLLSAKDGVVLFKDLPVQAPMAAVRETFCKLYEDTKLVTQLNAVFPGSRQADLSAFYDKSINQKITFQLTPPQFQHILSNRQDIVTDLGAEFLQVLEFYNNVHQYIIGRLQNLAASAITGCPEQVTDTLKKVRGIHYGMNHEFKLHDYFPVHRNLKRWDEHRDYCTFTLIFQDQRQSGLEAYLENTWVPVPTNAELAFLWGWSSFIMSNGRVPVALYRVVPLKTIRYGKVPRRNEVVFHIAPDMEAYLHPTLIYPEEPVSFHCETVRNLCVSKFKELFDKEELNPTLTVESTASSLRFTPKQVLDANMAANIELELGLVEAAHRKTILAQDSYVINLLLGHGTS